MNDPDGSLELGDNEYQPQKRLMSFMFRKKVYPIPKDDERTLHPLASANIISKIFFWWLFPILKVGYSRTLQPNDLWVLTDDMKVEHFTDKFNFYLAQEREKAQRKHIANKCKERNETPETSSVTPEDDLQDFVLTPFNMIMILMRTLKGQLIFATLMAQIGLCGLAFSPLLSKYLIQFVQERALGLEPHPGKGIGYAFGVVLLSLTSGILFTHFFYWGFVMGTETKSLLTNEILKKSLKLSPEGRHKFPTGKITSMITTDLSRIEIAVIMQPLLICLPLPMIIAIVVLVVNIGVSAVVGIGIFLSFLGVLSVGAKKLFDLREVVSKITDKRVNLIKEILNNLKMIKYYSWELPYHRNIMLIRDQEVNIILKIQAIRNVIYGLAMTLTGISSMIAFLVLYAIKGNTANPANIFSSLSAFGILAILIFFMPQALSTSADMAMGFKRIGALLCAPEEISYENYRNFNDPENKLAVGISQASFKWMIFEDEILDEESLNEETDETDNNNNKKSKKKKKLSKKAKAEREQRRKELEKDIEERKKDREKYGSTNSTNFSGFKNINLSIKKGEFVVITGPVGSGKTSLLNAIAGTMKCEQGEIDINGQLLLCGAPWIQNSTIRENIIFGSEFDQKFYESVVHACSLQIDLDNLPGGDFTEVGERGITLSGGQKARIHLARAVYANKDIVLMDDILSAVDARVGKHILNNCLLGLLKDKTRILATHQLALIGQADKIVVVDKDGSIDSGTMTELLQRNETFSKLMEYSKLEQDKEEFDSDSSDTNEKSSLVKVHETIDSEEEECEKYNVNKSVAKGKIIEDEERAINHITLDIYHNYIQQGSGKLGVVGFLAVFVLLISLYTFCSIFTNTWLSFWISHKFPGRGSGFYIGLYVMFNLLTTILLVVSFIALITMTTVSSKNLNLKAINRILYTPMAFMDVTPMGRILNRFTKDTDVLDNEISENLRFLAMSIAQMIGSFILFIIYIPWIALAIPFIGIFFVMIANYFQASNREVKRLEAILRSFVYNNVNEVLSGMETIKSYDAQLRFGDISSKYINHANEASFLVYACQRWVAIQLELLADAVLLLVALLCVNKVFDISPASVGLLLTYSLQISGELSNVIRTFTQVENDMNSVERVCHYGLKLDQEAPYTIADTKPSSDWPQQGEIEFAEASMKYRPELPLVLKNLSFSVSPHEKVGICGRTGAGKSSIMSAIYRLVELEGGKIVIDGVDISTIGMNDLRSKLSIIPQDPVLFNGTIRSNLDPFKEHQDDALWDSLSRSGIVTTQDIEEYKKIDKSTPSEDLPKFHLDKIVEDEGLNFSLGERQLVSFARAMVRESKILILDEATSSIDYKTDNTIQKTIATEFAHCTILCIAHRLKTILNYDSILVMDKGEVAEFDTPWKLFNTPGSTFREMCDKSNISEDDFEHKY
ncbi:uncharacterized protein J8A68_004892 [[Candida] subhashii]|uniref:Oligomycin resistance ATP-dependent permease YOR1 n=1 Tax=[Candida] subhashii TaxID=561895 RepID=A0A8J5UF00_9ASCO|nr:uncharacterized protein J8A68_004892 [[Candida] subhashii]KAG7661623.1 hypothetical protein J8A68_004892 [[Candida] subhashii]